MAEEFNPYREWLDIPLEEQPPNHYRLLGVKLFESDVQAIEAAADERMAHLKTFATSQYSSLSQKLLNECAAAKVCLTDARKKEIYDEGLREQLSPKPAMGPKRPTPKAVPAAGKAAATLEKPLAPPEDRSGYSLAPERPSGKSAAAAVTAPAGLSAMDSLLSDPVLANELVGGPAAAAPALVLPRPRRQVPAWVWAALGAGGAAVVLIAIVVVVGMYAARSLFGPPGGTPVVVNQPSTPNPRRNGSNVNPRPPANPRNSATGRNGPATGIPSTGNNSAGTLGNSANASTDSARNFTPGRDLRELSGRGSLVSIEFTPDGWHLVAGYVFGDVTYWNLRTGKPEFSHRVPDAAKDLGAPDVGGGFHRPRLAVSPDGTRLAVASPTLLYTWNLSGNQQRWFAAAPSVQGKAADFDMLAYSPDGKYLAANSRAAPGEIALYDTATGEEARRLAVADSKIGRHAFSRDGTRLVAHRATRGGSELVIWDPATGTELKRCSVAAKVKVSAISPDGRYVAVDEGDRLALWEPLSGQKLWTSEKFEYTSVTSLLYDGDGRTLLAGCRDRYARLLDAATGKVLQKFDNVFGAESVSITPDGRLVATGGADGVVRLWEVTSSASTPRDPTILASTSPIGTANPSRTFSPAGSEPAAVPNFFRESRFDGLFTANIDDLAFVDDKSLLVAVSDKTMGLVATATGRTIRGIARMQSNVERLCVSPDGKRAALLVRTPLGQGPGAALEGWDLDKGTRIWTVPMTHRSRMDVAWSGDGKFVAATYGSQPRSAGLYNGASGTRIRLLSDHPDEVTALAFSPDSKLLVCGSKDLRLWEVDTGSLVQTFGDQAGLLWDIAWSRDGRWLATVGSGGEARLWDPGAGKQIWECRSHSGFSETVDFSADNRYVLSGGWDSKLALADVATGRLLATYEHGGSVKRVCFSPDGARVASFGGFDKQIKLWNFNPNTSDPASVPVPLVTDESAPIRISAFSPQRGFFNDEVTITGQGFDGVEGVVFSGAGDGKSYPAEFTYVTDSELVVKVPRIFDADEGCVIAISTPKGIAVTVPKNAIVVDAREEDGRGSVFYLVRKGGHLTALGGSTRTFVMDGGKLDSGGGGSKTIYLQAGAALDSLGGGGNAVFAAPKAKVSPAARSAAGRSLVRTKDMYPSFVDRLFNERP
jgi:WD40 repeat protein